MLNRFQKVYENTKIYMFGFAGVLGVHFGVCPGAVGEGCGCG